MAGQRAATYYALRFDRRENERPYGSAGGKAGERRFLDVTEAHEPAVS